MQEMTAHNLTINIYKHGDQHSLQVHPGVRMRSAVDTDIMAAGKLVSVYF